MSATEERISYLRSNMGEDFILFADANQKYIVREAIEVSNMLAEYGVAWFEEPVIADDIHGYAELNNMNAITISG